MLLCPGRFYLSLELISKTNLNLSVGEIYEAQELVSFVSGDLTNEENTLKNLTMLVCHVCSLVI